MRVYFDNNATTPVHPEVSEVAKEALDVFGNASSYHSFGREARERVESARAILADAIGAEPSEIMFTSGGSESNNLVLKGLICGSMTCPNRSGHRVGRHIITSQIEHPSVYDTCRCLEAEGYLITYLPVDSTGMVNPDDLRKAITSNTSLISIMMANNEVGTMQPVKEIAAIAGEHGIPFHSDAVQVVGKLDVSVNDLGIDFLSLSGHKINAPKGIGALYMRKTLSVCPLIHGGPQEMSRRAGTENNVGIIALGKAIDVMGHDRGTLIPEIERLRDRLETGLLEKVPDIRVNGHREKRLPGTTNISFKYVEGESILLSLDAEGIAVSTGSACSSGSLEPSHVLLAMGMSHEDAHGSIRFSLGYGNTDPDVDYALEHIPPVIQRLRDMSPLYHAGKQAE
ncbi:cysteine desulfurase family protein [candidate division KSB1 bacterium]